MKTEVGLFEKEVLPFKDKYEIRINHFIDSDINHLFNTASFFKIHANNKSYYIQLCRINTNQVLCTAHFTPVLPGIFRSPAKGTFGGYTIKSNLHFEIYEQFISAVEHYLVLNGAKEIQLTVPPASHDLALFSMTHHILVRHGYKVLYQDLNYHMIVDSNAFIGKIDYERRRILKKCLQQGFTVQQLDSTSYDTAYSVIKEHRYRRGYPITMELEQIMKMIRTFPDRMLLFAVYYKKKMVASSINIILNPKILYIFYLGDVADTKRYSPMILLIANIYDYGHKNGFNILDFGISTYQGEPNYGLIQYKKFVGFSESLKLTYSKSTI